MSDELGIKELIGQLNLLKNAVRDYAVRDDNLDTEHRTRVFNRNKAQETAAWNMAARLEQQSAETETNLQAAKDHALARFEQRQKRLAQAQRTSQKQSLDRIMQWEGRGKYEVQKNSMDLERRRETETAAATAQYDQTREWIARSRERFQLLETQAQKAFQGYAAFVRWLDPRRAWDTLEPTPNETSLTTALDTLEKRVLDELRHFRAQLPPRFFGRVPRWFWLLLWLGLLGAGFIAIDPVSRQFGWGAVSTQNAGWIDAILAIGTGGVYGWGRWIGGPAARRAAFLLATARRWHDDGEAMAEDRRQRELQRIQKECEHTQAELDLRWQETVRQAAERRDQCPRQIADKAERIAKRHEQRLQTQLGQMELRRDATLAGLREEAERARQKLADDASAHINTFEADYNAKSRQLRAECEPAIQTSWAALSAMNRRAAALFPGWDRPEWDSWEPPETFINAASFGVLEVDLAKFAEVRWENRERALPCPKIFTLPLVLTYPSQGSLLFETSQAGGEEAVKAMNNVIYRLLSTTPPGKLSLTILDPVGLGQNFAGLMHLADFEDVCIESRIWTQPQQIEEKLGELTEHMEKVIQMRLRNEYPSIVEYNLRAGVIAEKYHLLAIAGFPVNFTENAARRLLNIAASGARCGVFTLIHWDRRHSLPHDFLPAELRKHSLCVTGSEKGLYLADFNFPGLRLTLETPPSADFATRFLRQVGTSGKNRSRVEVPFESIAPAQDGIWTEDPLEELRVPIGLAGPGKWQYLALGKGTRQHALIAGKTGSGKSTLFHVVITNLALRFSPEQVEFYLVDFKKGVEFRCYGLRRLPHARVVAIESDRAFGLSVLLRVDEELRRRGDLFRKFNAQDLAAYRKAAPGAPMSRCLLVIDEFQELFTEEDRVSQHAAVLLDRLVRQGRAFGIHVLLGSQTLGGAYTLARTTLGQMVVRIALQCNEADAFLIMDEHNGAPRLLSRPGEGIYNDTAGSLEGNSPFQTAWMSDETRDACLTVIRQRADEDPHPWPGPMVFEGNAPADIRENQLLREALERPAAQPIPRLWLGAPNAIKGPTEVLLRRQSGAHLLVVGQREEAALAIVCLGLVALAAQHPRDTVRFVVLDVNAPGSWQRTLIDRVLRMVPQQVVRPKHNELGTVFQDLVAETQRRAQRQTDAPEPAVFVLIHQLEKFRSLQQEDEFSLPSDDNPAEITPAAALPRLLSEGAAVGVHLLATCDICQNILRILGRKTLGAVSWRVLFQMSANDAATLSDTTDAATLGLHRALLYNDQEGCAEVFRPYALPDNAWLDEAARLLARHGPAPT